MAAISLTGYNTPVNYQNTTYPSSSGGSSGSTVNEAQFEQALGKGMLTSFCQMNMTIVQDMKKSMDDYQADQEE